MPYARSTSLVMKTSAVMIAAGGERQVYPSVNAVPATLRKMLQDTTSGANSATILIADRRGKEEIAKALERVSEAVARVTRKPGCAHSGTFLAQLGRSRRDRLCQRRDRLAGLRPSLVVFFAIAPKVSSAFLPKLGHGNATIPNTKIKSQFFRQTLQSSRLTQSILMST